MLTADKDNTPSAGQFEATAGDLKGYFKGRILPGLPLTQELREIRTESGHPPSRRLRDPQSARAAPRPSPIRPAVGMPRASNLKSAKKTATKPSSRRSITSASSAAWSSSIARPEELHHRGRCPQRRQTSARCPRSASSISAIFINLKGNAQSLEVTSNQELFKQSVPFQMERE